MTRVYKNGVEALTEQSLGDGQKLLDGELLGLEPVHQCNHLSLLWRRKLIKYIYPNNIITANLMSKVAYRW